MEEEIRLNDFHEDMLEEYVDELEDIRCPHCVKNVLRELFMFAYFEGVNDHKKELVDSLIDEIEEYEESFE